VRHCHARNITPRRPAPCTVINGGTFVVQAQLAHSRAQSAAVGLRAHTRLAHDGATVSRTDAIPRRSGEASGVVANFLWLSSSQQSGLVNFLNTL
jgi:CxxC motif-containing protein (DUF1111 family)